MRGSPRLLGGERPPMCFVYWLLIAIYTFAALAQSVVAGDELAALASCVFLVHRAPLATEHYPGQQQRRALLAAARLVVCIRVRTPRSCIGGSQRSAVALPGCTPHVFHTVCWLLQLAALS